MILNPLKFKCSLKYLHKSIILSEFLPLFLKKERKKKKILAIYFVLAVSGWAIKNRHVCGVLLVLSIIYFQQKYKLNSFCQLSCSLFKFHFFSF